MKMRFRHLSIVDTESNRSYDLRRNIWWALDTEYFNALNTDGHVIGLNGYCLDALNEVPAGGMISAPRHGRQQVSLRTLTLAEVNMIKARIEEMVDEILKEEAEHE